MRSTWSNAAHEHNRQLTRTLPLGQVETNVYDDRSLAEIDAASQPRSSSTGLGQLKSSVDFEGRVTAYFYDNTTIGGGRLVKKQFFTNATAYNNGDGTPSETVSYEYDTFGRLNKTKSDTNGSPGSIEREVTNGYDDEGHLTSVVSPEGTIHYGYHSVTGQRTRTYTNDTDTEYVYDDLGRLSQVVVHKRFSTTLAEPETTGYQYDLLGNLAKVKLSDGLVTDYTYDAMNRLTKQVNYLDLYADGVFDTVNGDILRSSYDYKLDVHNRRTQTIEQLNVSASTNDPMTAQFDWVYDKLGQLTKETYDHNTSAANTADDYVAEYKFDLVGNRLSKTIDKRNAAGIDETITSKYDKNDRLLREVDDLVSGTDIVTFYQYDNGDGDGDQFDGTVQSNKATYNFTGTAPTSEPTSGATSTTAYTYNLQGRLKQVVVDSNGAAADGVTTTTYTYSDDGLRVSQTINDGTTTTTTVFVVDNNNPTGYSQTLEEKDASGNVMKTFVLGHDVIAQATAAAASATLYLLYDGHGSTRGLLDDVGNVAQNGSAIKQLFTYDAYGNLTGPSATFVRDLNNAMTSLLYSGEQTDRNGDQNLRDRIYNSTTGRFLTVDRYSGNFNDPQSLHKYLYVHANPINAIDPSGLFLAELWLRAQAASANAVAYTSAIARLYYYHAVSTISVTLAAVASRLPAPLQRAVERLASLPSQTWQRVTQWLSRPIIPSQTESARQGFSNHTQIVEYWALRGVNQIHHIVEQGINRFTFLPQSIHSPLNTVPLLPQVHDKISAFYASGADKLQFMQAPVFSGVVRLRDYVSTGTWEQQYRFGIEVLTWVATKGTMDGFNPVTKGLIW